MSSVVLVHGSWHDGELWSPVIDSLADLGYTAYGPTIAGHGKGAVKDVNHADCVQSIVDYIVDNDLGDFSLVAHSFGGTVICKVAEAVPDRINRLVFQSAFVLEDGNALFDEVPQFYRESFEQIAAASSDNTIMLPFELWQSAFINDASDELASSTYEMLSSEPFQPFLDKLDLKKFYGLTIPSSYINCRDDIALPAGEWAWCPRFPNRLKNCRLLEMPGSHEVMLTNPQALAETIVEACAV